MISKFAERYEAHSYSQLVRRALGKKLAATLRVVLSVYLCGSCVAYMVIIGDCFTPLLAGLLGGGGSLTSAALSFSAPVSPKAGKRARRCKTRSRRSRRMQAWRSKAPIVLAL